MSLDLHLLRTFCVVAEEENVTRAANRLFLSAPSISAHLKTLEDELGVRLFTRSARGMALTKAGSVLWEDAEQILKQTAQLRRKAQNLSEDVSGMLRIGINNPPETLFVEDIIDRLSQQFPTLRFDCGFGASQIILNGLRSDLYDVGFFEGPRGSADLVAVELERRELVLVSPIAWGEELQKATVGQLQEYPWIFASEGCSYYRFAHDWQQTRGLKIEERIRTVNDDWSTMSFVARGLGLSIVSKNVLTASPYSDQVAVLPHLEGSVPLSIGFLKERQDENLVQRTVETVQSIWQEKTTLGVTNGPSISR
ncbi:LysR family transcriptional regulator [Cerasicoccus maritimus]|uniref:LysR family transcriptional regulator n=1 Tax=Cerasicoccus maritimus TaxID=490089 RepID=UPI002852D94C|nr:LysR family transcriptional regulator [Cerasicoccus maritimus]